MHCNTNYSLIELLNNFLFVDFCHTQSTFWNNLVIPLKKNICEIFSLKFLVYATPQIRLAIFRKKCTKKRPHKSNRWLSGITGQFCGLESAKWNIRDLTFRRCSISKVNARSEIAAGLIRRWSQFVYRDRRNRHRCSRATLLYKNNNLLPCYSNERLYM